MNYLLDLLKIAKSGVYVPACTDYSELKAGLGAYFQEVFSPTPTEAVLPIPAPTLIASPVTMAPVVKLPVIVPTGPKELPGQVPAVIPGELPVRGFVPSSPVEPKWYVNISETKIPNWVPTIADPPSIVYIEANKRWYLLTTGGGDGTDRKGYQLAIALTPTDGLPTPLRQAVYPLVESDYFVNVPYAEVVQFKAPDGPAYQKILDGRVFNVTIPKNHSGKSLLRHLSKF